MEKDQEIKALKKRLSDLAKELHTISTQLGWIAEEIMLSQET